MTRPVRLQLLRRRGFNLQMHSYAINGLEAVVCSRPGRWGNPFIVGFRKRFGCKGRLGYFDAPSATQAIVEFRAKFEAEGRGAEELRGKNLACWCRLCALHAAAGKPFDAPCLLCAPCHTDVLGVRANGLICDAAP